MGVRLCGKKAATRYRPSRIAALSAAALRARRASASGDALLIGWSMTT